MKKSNFFKYAGIAALLFTGLVSSCSEKEDETQSLATPEPELGVVSLSTINGMTLVGDGTGFKSEPKWVSTSNKAPNADDPYWQWTCRLDYHVKEVNTYAPRNTNGSQNFSFNNAIVDGDGNLLAYNFKIENGTDKDLVNPKIVMAGGTIVWEGNGVIKPGTTCFIQFHVDPAAAGFPSTFDADDLTGKSFDAKWTYDGAEVTKGRHTASINQYAKTECSAYCVDCEESEVAPDGCEFPYFYSHPIETSTLKAYLFQGGTLKYTFPINLEETIQEEIALGTYDVVVTNYSGGAVNSVDDFPMYTNELILFAVKENFNFLTTKKAELTLTTPYSAVMIAKNEFLQDSPTKPSVDGNDMYDVGDWWNIYTRAEGAETFAAKDSRGMTQGETRSYQPMTVYRYIICLKNIEVSVFLSPDIFKCTVDKVLGDY